jgi:tRNA-splicing ligase RtcB (3'-phosphate/5'-hydroxy nucleic acid ligase)
MPAQRIEGGALPILSWSPDLEPGALRQAANCAGLPVAFHHVAVMADGHQGYGVPIGAVMALDGAISPYAVGNDIGCGMAMVPTTVTRDELLSALPTKAGAHGAVARDEIMGRVQAAIPSGSGTRSGDDAPVEELHPLLQQAFDALVEASSVTGLEPSTSQSAEGRGGRSLERSDFVARGRVQAGTLGSGNHFIELLSGPDDDVWVMLHSGSRGVGSLLCNNFHRMALAHCAAEGLALPDPGLAWLPVGGSSSWGRVGDCYRRALRGGLDYAELNRRRMLEEVGRIVERHYPGAMRWDDMVNIHHNDATLEPHFGREVWVHRKGAVKASAGTATITPGSMGTGSFLGRGLGHPDSFSSCSHGAGRRMSRGRARAELSLEAELSRITAAGGKVFATSKEAVLDEMPAAYKDLDQVMAAQADLVEPVKRFTPLGTYKGADRGRPRRRKNKAGWRPAEER